MRQPFVLYHDFNNGELHIACFSDLHHQHPSHNAKLCDADFQEAADLGCRMLILGDLNDLILLKDPRFQMSSVRKRQKIVDAMFNDAVRHSTERLKPYADFIDMIALGNHETAVLQHRAADFVLSLIGELQHHRSDKLPRIVHGGYKGLFRVQFEQGRWRKSQVWYYDHGRGGGAPVTKGMININRIMRDWEADVYWLGHRCTSISDDQPARYLAKSNHYAVRRRLAFYTAGYEGEIKEEDYNEDGYTLDWAEEHHDTVPAEGYAVVRYELKTTEGDRKVKRKLERGYEI